MRALAKLFALWSQQRAAKPRTLAKMSWKPIGIVLFSGLALSLYTAVALRPGTGVQDTLVDPPVITSRNGVLRAELKIGRERVFLGGRPVIMQTYNSLYVPPTLRVHPGDTIQLRLTNAIAQRTNLHYHGMNVSPHSDNIFLQINPGQSFDYQVVIPRDHPPGLFWYHSHAHTLSEYQVMSGLSGAIVVEGLLDPVPQLRGIRERMLLLKDIQIENGDTIPTNIDSNAGTTRTVNGKVGPLITIEPGETQLWRIGNIGADIFYRLKLDGHALYELARDGNRHNQLVPRDEILLPPGARVEVLVQGGAAGVYQLRTLGYDTGPAGDQYPEVVLATLVSQGATRPPQTLSVALPPVEDLRTRPVTRKRLITFTETADGNTFFINGKMFDPERTDITTELGALEEWTIQNDSDEDHVFHIHQLDFQVVKNNGAAVPFTGYQDTKDVSPHGEAKLLVPFTRAVMAGRFVFHCHILSHEDHGMMATIVVRN